MAFLHIFSLFFENSEKKKSRLRPYISRENEELLRTFLLSNQKDGNFLK